MCRNKMRMIVAQNQTHFLNLPAKLDGQSWPVLKPSTRLNPVSALPQKAKIKNTGKSIAPNEGA